MIEIIVTLAIVGFLVWLLTTLIPMPAPFKTGIYALAGLFVLLYILNALGLYSIGSLGHSRVRL